MVNNQADRVRRMLNIRELKVIDPEYVKGDELVTQVGAVDVIWAEMGNTYALCYHMHNSGGAELAKTLMDRGVLYVGSSAGAIFAGRTCQTAFWKNWDDKTAEGTINV